jgi:hypothetical protein
MKLGTLLNLIIVLYAISRNFVLEEKYKSQFDKNLGRFNTFLINIKDGGNRFVLLLLSKRLLRLCYIGCGMLVLVMLIKIDSLLIPLCILLFFAFFLHMSIQWVLDHEKIVDKTLRSSTFWLVIVSPLLFATAQFVLGIPVYDQLVALPILKFTANMWLNAALLTVLVFFVFCVVPYFLLWAISIPLLFFQFSLVFALRKFFKISYRVNKNLVDAVVVVAFTIGAVFLS